MGYLDKKRQMMESKQKADAGNANDNGNKPKAPINPAMALPPEAKLDLEAVIAPGQAGEKKPTDANAKDAEEREAFLKAEHVIRKGTVMRISFGGVLNSKSPQEGAVLPNESASSDDCDHMQGYVWGLGRKPVPVRSLDAAMEDDMVYPQVAAAVTELEALSIPLEEGPYADKDGKMAEFADAVFKGVKDGDSYALIEHVMDTRPFTDPDTEAMCRRIHRSGYNFTLDQEFMTSDELPTAGQILSDETRLYLETASGVERMRLVHPMECYLLAVSALRRRGLMAYPAHAVVPTAEGGELSHPLIAIVDLAKEVPLTTFDLFRFHPNMASVDIMSDVSVQGILHAMRAEARVKHLTVAMKTEANQGRAIVGEDFDNQLVRITRSVFECYKAWPGSHFINRALTYLYNDLTQVFIAADPAMALPDMETAPIVTGPGTFRLRSKAEATAEKETNKVEDALGYLIAQFEKKQ